MALKTGKQYIDSLRDGRRLYIDGKVVSDVTAYPPLQGVIDTIASLCDDQHDPAYRDVLTYRSPTTGEPVSTTYLEARTAAEFKALAGCFHLRALRTFGLMGRLTDFMSAFLVDQAVALRALGKTEAAARAQSMVEHCRENDLQVTHALIDPQTDRSTLDAPSQAVQVVERRAEGVVVSGCRMLSTLAPVANECYVGPYYPRQPGEEKFVLAFVVPMNAPGLSILARESFHRGEDVFDRPLSSRFDEGDAILMFDKVLVPHDRMIIDGDLAAYNGMLSARPGYTPHPGHHPLDHEAALPGRRGDGDRARQRPGQAAALPGRDRRADRPGERRRRHPRRGDRGRPAARRSLRARRAQDRRRWA